MVIGLLHNRPVNLIGLINIMAVDYSKVGSFLKPTLRTKKKKYDKTKILNDLINLVILDIKKARYRYWMYYSFYSS